MNKIFILGNLTKDPVKTVIKDDCVVVNFTVAVNRRTSADKNPETDYFPVVAWRGLGENCAKYLKKGSKVCVVGSMQMRTYEAADGSKRSAAEVIAEEVQFLSLNKQEELSTVDKSKDVENG